MNLIGHFACASKASPKARLGAVLPDLLGLYARKVRPRPLLREWEGETATLHGAADVVAGIDQHHAVDRHFHRAPLFTDFQAALMRLMRQASDTPGIKRFFPAHVLSEMYFDHLLMARHPNLGDMLTQALEEGQPLLEAFCVRHPAVERQDFSRFMGRILADRFWEDYRDHEGIFYRMNRILARFSMRSLEPVETTAISETFTQQAATTQPLLFGFVETMCRLDENGNLPDAREETPQESRLAQQESLVKGECPPVLATSS